MMYSCILKQTRGVSLQHKWRATRFLAGFFFLDFATAENRDYKKTASDHVCSMRYATCSYPRHLLIAGERPEHVPPQRQ